MVNDVMSHLPVTDYVTVPIVSIIGLSEVVLKQMVTQEDQEFHIIPIPKTERERGSGFCGF